SRLWSWRTRRFRPRSSVPASTRYGAATTSHIHQSDCPSASQPACFATSASAIRIAAAASAKGAASLRASRAAACKRAEPGGGATGGVAALIAGPECAQHRTVWRLARNQRKRLDLATRASSWKRGGKLRLGRPEHLS